MQASRRRRSGRNPSGQRPGDAAADALIDAYATGHRAFPQEPTSDQYFQPSQFRAYRALGHAIGRQAALALERG